MLTKPLETLHALKIGFKWATFTNSLFAKDGAEESIVAPRMCVIKYVLCEAYRRIRFW